MSTKACHITSVHNRYDIRIFEKECVSLAKTGWDVTLIVNDSHEGEIRKGVKIVSVNFQAANRFQRIFNISLQNRIFNQAVLLNADIYHFHDPELIPVGIKLLKTGKKVIYDVHEDVPRQILVKEWIPLVFRKPISMIFEKHENTAAKKFSAIIVPTPHLAGRFSQIKNKVVQVCNFPLLSEFKDYGRSSLLVNSGCYVGDLSIARGIRQIAEATKKVKIKLDLCGEFQSGKLRDEILTSYDHINYLGYLDRAGVSSLLYNSQIGFVTLMPSPNYIYSYPIKIFEYMAAGVPVIASNFEVYREIVEGNQCGICVNPFDVDEISKAIEQIIKNPEKAKIMGENGRRAIIEKYNWDTQEKILIELYEEL